MYRSTKFLDSFRNMNPRRSALSTAAPETIGGGGVGGPWRSGRDRVSGRGELLFRLAGQGLRVRSAPLAGWFRVGAEGPLRGPSRLDLDLLTCRLRVSRTPRYSRDPRQSRPFTVQVASERDFNGH